MSLLYTAKHVHAKLMHPTQSVSAIDAWALGDAIEAVECELARVKRTILLVQYTDQHRKAMGQIELEIDSADTMVGVLARIKQLKPKHARYCHIKSKPELTPLSKVQRFYML